jgi:hypothetical protein
METTRDFQHNILNSYACIPKDVFDNAASLYTRNNMLNDDP